MLGSPFYTLFAVGGLSLLLWAFTLRDPRADATLLKISGAVLLCFSLVAVLSPRMLFWGWVVQLTVAPSFGAMLLRRSWLTPLGTGHRVRLGLAGCLMLSPVLIVIGFLGLMAMFGFHGPGYFNDPEQGSRNIALTAAFLASLAVMAAGAWSLRTMLLGAAPHVEGSESGEDYGVARRRWTRCVVAAVAILAGGAGIYFVLGYNDSSRVRQPGVTPCTPESSEPLCHRWPR